MVQLRPSTDSSPSSKVPPDYFSRGVQYRLMALVFSLLLVLFLAAQAAKPETWNWMFANNSGATVADDATNEQLEDPSIDTRLLSKPPVPSPPGVITIEPTEFTDEPISDSSGTIDADDSKDATFFLGVSPDRYEVVKDNTVFRSSESRLWYDVLAGLRDSREELENEIAQPVGFTQLYKQPAAYRGRLVEISGTVRRAHVITARKNEHDIPSYVRCWLFPNGTTNPIVVYATEMPIDFPTGMSINEPVRFRGVFFKRWAYQADGGIMTAPLVLAKTGDWTPAPAAEPKQAVSSNKMYAGGALAAVAGCLIAWLVYLQSLKSDNVRDSHGSINEHELDASFQRLAESNIESPREAMGRIGEQVSDEN